MISSNDPQSADDPIRTWRTRWTGRAVGADTDAVLGRLLDLDSSAIEALRSSGVI